MLTILTASDHRKAQRQRQPPLLANRIPIQISEAASERTTNHSSCSRTSMAGFLSPMRCLQSSPPSPRADETQDLSPTNDELAFSLHFVSKTRTLSCRRWKLLLFHCGHHDVVSLDLVEIVSYARQILPSMLICIRKKFVNRSRLTYYYS